MSVAGSGDGLNDIYEALDSYRWDDDAEFQSGLHAILGNTSSPEQAAELTLRARCFYYARKHNTVIDFDAYKAFRAAHNRPPLALAPTPVRTEAALPRLDDEPAGGTLPVTVSNANEPPAPYPTSFARIVELVTTGQPIPGIKEIPNTVLSGQGSQAAKVQRKKPWEVNTRT